MDLDLRMSRRDKFLFKVVIRSIAVGSFAYFMLATPTEMDKKLGLDQPMCRFIEYMTRIIFGYLFDAWYFSLMDKAFGDEDGDELEVQLAPAG